MASIATASTTLTDDEITLPTIPMSYDEYLDWYDKEAGRRGEWVDGEAIQFVSTTFTHKNLVSFLNALLRIVVRRRRLGTVVGSSYELRTREGAAREPDLMVIFNEHRDRITERRLVGAADLVVEVISPDSVTRDSKVKFTEYAAAGIPEYWVVDPRAGRESFDMFTVTPGGEYVAVRPDGQGLFRSLVLPGVWFDPSWLTTDELPDEVDLGLAMAGDPTEP